MTAKSAQAPKFRQNVFSFSNLHKAYKSCLRGKINKNSALEFEANRERNLLEMSRELSARTYRPGPFTCFAVSEPKIREVWAADFKDRVVHHLLVAEIEHIWEKIFIHDSYACRKKKGAHKALKKIKKLLNKDRDLFYLHLDARGFFTNIDKEILFSILKTKLKHPDLLYLAKLIIFQNPKEEYIVKGDYELLRGIPSHKSLFGVPDGKGLPIGNYTSQFFANVYLNELDQYAKRQLKCKHYFRYMDDMVIFDRDKAKLKSLIGAVDTFLKVRLKLELHPKKIVLQKADKGIDFLGYIIRPDYSLSRKRIVGNLKGKLARINATLQKAETEKNIQCIEETVKRALCVINSYWGHFKHADCGDLKRKLGLKHFDALLNYIESVPNKGHFVIKKDAFPKKSGLLRDD